MDVRIPLPRMNKSERKKLRLAYAVLIVAAVISVGVIVWLAWIRPAQESANIKSYQDCVEAGYPIQTKYPPVCVTPDGTSFTDPEAEPAPRP